MSTTSIPTRIQLRRPGGLRTLLRCLSYLRPYQRRVISSYLFMLINNGITIAMPLLIGWVVDNGIRAGRPEVIGWGVMALMAVTLVRAVLIYLFGRGTEVASQNVAYDMRNAIHQKLQSLSFSYHDRSETGQLLARAVSDVDRVRFLTGRAILRLVEVVTLIVGVAISMIALNVSLALLTLLIVPFLAYAALRFGTIFRPLYMEIQKQMAEMTTRLEQNLRGARVVKAFAQEAAEIARFERETQELFNTNMRAARTRATNLPLLELGASAGTIFILLYGGQLVIGNQLTLGELVAFTGYVGQLTGPVRRLGMIVSGIAQSIASGERVFEILDAQSDVVDRPDAVPMPKIEGHVRFAHVSFAYFRHNVLSDVDFEVQPGQIVALLGMTGSGKSSIINLIPRFYDPTEGQILIDGHNIRRVKVNSLREQIGIVLQDTILFAATVRENIAFGLPDATDEQIVAAAQAASAHDFIMAMAEQYDTYVGEKGMTLSGGQKQRLAIARAILKDPAILILDDATSSVDTETELLIQQALSRLMQGRTSFVIAQRLSTVRQADLVLVLEKGRIAACGYRTAEHSAHEQLLQTSGLYAEIYARQLRPQEDQTPVLER